MESKQTVSIEETRLARKGFLKKAFVFFAGLSLIPGITKAFEKTGDTNKSQSNSGTQNILSANPFIGEIQLVAFNFAPTGWALCNGQIMSISQNTALFSLLGTMYGGDGVTTFALPDLQGRVPIHQGNGIGLSPYIVGQAGGSEDVTLSTNQIPAHNHSIQVSSSVGTSDTPSGMYIAKNSEGVKQFSASADGSASPTAAAGAGQPHSNIQPYLTINYIIALQGIFPSRS